MAQGKAPRPPANSATSSPAKWPGSDPSARVAAYWRGPPGEASPGLSSSATPATFTQFVTQSVSPVAASAMLSGTCAGSDSGPRPEEGSQIRALPSPAGAGTISHWPGIVSRRPARHPSAQAGSQEPRPQAAFHHA